LGIGAVLPIAFFVMAMLAVSACKTESDPPKLPETLGSDDDNQKPVDIDSIVSDLTAQGGGNSADNPVKLLVSHQLTEENWKAILTAIDTAGKYVVLDLSTCTCSSVQTGGGLRSNGVFYLPANFDTGKSFVVSLILPDLAESISGSSFNSSYNSKGFSSFKALTSVSASAVTSIGDWAFGFCTSLTSLSFPAVTGIGDGAFYDCNSLTSVSFPVATNTGDWAFTNCTSLSSVSFPTATSIGNGAFKGCINLSSENFPNVTEIGQQAFWECTSLSSVSFPMATDIGDSAFCRCTNLASVSFPATTNIDSYAFINCTSLGSINFPAAVNIGNSTFSGCTSLTNVSLPMVTEIGETAFLSCTSLTSVNFPKMTFINYMAFGYTGDSPLTIILGSTAPTIEARLFEEVRGAKAVTVKVPVDATGYGTIPQTYSGDNTTESWGNGFRGGSWNGTGFRDGSRVYGINRYITLRIEYQ
jgi:hypothetical protein